MNLTLAVATKTMMLETFAKFINRKYLIGTVAQT